MKVIPKWIVALGAAIAICGELSWLFLMIPAALPLVPLTRFPGFVWLIAIGFALPASIASSSPTGASQAKRRAVRGVEPAQDHLRIGNPNGTPAAKYQLTLRRKGGPLRTYELELKTQVV
jgi:hypothetical protein